MIKTWAQVKCRNDIVASENTTFSGRTALFTDEEEITSENIIEVLDSLFFYIYDNYRKIIMLKNYERGMQPISSRKKKVRADINNRVVVNLAHEIKEFKLGFIFGDPVTYVQRGIEDTRSGLNIDPDGRMADQGIAQLNEMMFEQGKASKDIQLANEFCTCGVGYRLIMANEDDDELSPFKIYPLQSETTFVVYSNTVSARKVLSGTFVIKDTGVVKLGCYTDTKYFELEGNLGSWVIVKEENNGIGINPIVEYSYDLNRQSCFEPVIKLIDSINMVESDRVNGIAQFIQAILWINNIKLDDKQFDDLMVRGALNTVDISDTKKANVEWLASELNQTSTQTVIDDLSEKALEIAGVPGREASTGGNTGQAIMLSNGWHIAETQAQAFEELFKSSENEFVRVALKIIKQSTKIKDKAPVKHLYMSDIQTKFNRNRTDNLLTKVQALQQMLESGVNPEIAFKICGLFADPHQAFIDSESYLGKWKYSDISSDSDDDMSKQNNHETDAAENADSEENNGDNKQ